MFLKRDPKIVDQLVANQKANVSLSKMNFGFAIYLETANGDNYSYIDPSYFSIEIVEHSYHLDDPTKNRLTNFSLVNCSESDFNKEIKTKKFCSECLCLKENSDINLYVNYDSMWYDDFSYISIRLNICSNFSSPVVCQPIETILDFLQGQFFSISFLEYFFDMKDYENPAKINIQGSKGIVLNKNLTQSTLFALMEVEILQDSNPIFDNGEILYSKYFQQDPSQDGSYFAFRTNDPNKNEVSFLGEFQIWPSLNKRQIIRKYQKLHEVFANIGGLATCLKFAGILLCSLSSYVKILRNILKKLYYPEIKQGKNKKKMTNKINEKVENEHQGFHVNVFSFSNSDHMMARNKNDIELENKLDISFQDKKKELHHKTKFDFSVDNKEKIDIGISAKISGKTNSEEIFKKSEKKLIFKLSACDYIKYFFRKSFKMNLNQKNQLIMEAEAAYKKDFDIIEILKKVQDLEKLKAFIFNDKQKKFFDLIEFKFNQNFLGEEDILLYYTDVKNHDFFSDIDHKLLNIYEMSKHYD